MRLRTWLLAGVLAALVAACGSSGAGTSQRSGSAPSRPATAAKLVILNPTANEVTGPSVNLQFQIVGGTVLPPAQVTGPLRGDQGHIHVSLDGKLVQMAFASQAQLTALAPGPHAVSAEWVATDHLPFRNRVVADVLFTVSGP